jgi:hypothetical protein
VESDIRFYRRRANEELNAANRAVTEAARERRMILAGIFFERLRASEARGLAESGVHDLYPVTFDPVAAASVFKWSEGRAARRA